VYRFTQVRNPSITQRLGPAALNTPPLIQPLATTLLADTTLLGRFTAPLFPVYTPFRGLQAFFWILEP
jgi:hypothetical protein